MALHTHEQRMTQAAQFRAEHQGYPTTLNGLTNDVATINATVSNLDSLYSTDAERVAAVNGLATTLGAAIDSGDTTVLGAIAAAVTVEAGDRDTAIATAIAAQPTYATIAQVNQNISGAIALLPAGASAADIAQAITDEQIARDNAIANAVSTAVVSQNATVGALDTRVGKVELEIDTMLFAG